MAGGRPLKFANVQELQTKIDAYFAERENMEEYPNGDIIPKHITITGLALALDTSRETICNYGDKDEFFDSVRKARLKCENYAEQKLFGGPAAGPIFALKNYGWKDTQDINQNNTGAPQVIVTKNYLPKND